MNKQLINKYKPEFDHWLNGGSLLARVITSDEDNFMYTIWYTIDSNNLEKWKAEYLFSLTNTQIEYYKPQFVINDEYIELRKALAEDKTIQLNEAEKFADSNRGWVDLSCKSLGKSTHFFPVNYYRIKPDESKFKVGDFVTNESLKITRQITKVDDDFIYFKEGSWALPHMKEFSNKLSLWTPVKGEWCWFYDKTSNKYSHLAKFNEMWKNKFRSTTDTPWQFCEPFLNSLPSYLKDK